MSGVGSGVGFEVGSGVGVGTGVAVGFGVAVGVGSGVEVGSGVGTGVGVGETGVATTFSGRGTAWKQPSSSNVPAIEARSSANRSRLTGTYPNRELPNGSVKSLTVLAGLNGCGVALQRQAE